MSFNRLITFVTGRFFALLASLPVATCVSVASTASKRHKANIAVGKTASKAHLYALEPTVLVKPKKSSAHSRV